MTLRVPMVSPERARELGEAMGMPARRTTSEAFRVVANNPGVARVAFGQFNCWRTTNSTPGCAR
jgi:hypothetical protein